MSKRLFRPAVHFIVTVCMVAVVALGFAPVETVNAESLIVDGTVATAFEAGFTYQGTLTDGGTAANGVYDFRFELLADGGIVGQEYIAENVQVTNGLFSTTVGITGSGMWNGQRRFLRVSARAEGEPTFVVIGEAVEVQPAPYAFFAREAASASVAGEANVATTLASGKSTAIQVGTFDMIESDGLSTLTFAARATGRLEVKRPAGKGTAFVYIPVDVPSTMLGMSQKLTTLSFCYSGTVDNGLGVLAGIQEVQVRQANQMTGSAMLNATYNTDLAAKDACVNVNANSPVTVDGSMWVRFKITASPVALEFGEIKLTFTN